MIDTSISRPTSAVTDIKHECLSPPMRTAIDGWLATSAVLLAFRGEDDDYGRHLTDANYRAACCVAAVPAQNFSDFAAKVYLAAAVECNHVGPGPLEYNIPASAEEYEGVRLWAGIISDLPQICPTVEALWNFTTGTMGAGQ